MLFNMGVSLYTSRLILKVLGVEDFGIYNLVAGVVVLFSFLNNSMSSATQRFINVERATKLSENVKRVFNLSVKNHLIISLFVLALAESVGLWFLNNKLNIPDAKIAQANIVYQISIATTILGIMRMPLNAIIVAHEKMAYYAFVGVFETLSRLSIAVFLYLVPNVEHLPVYAALYLIAEMFSSGIMLSYCRRQFRTETTLGFYKDPARQKEMLFFSGWTLLGQVAYVGANQGLAMILNIFHGVVVNAALGIANQVNAAIYGFVGNFQIAFNPQIVQSYSLGDLGRSRELIFSTSKYSFFLMTLLSAPILFFTHTILTIWLGDNLPMYVEVFVQVVIFCSLIDAISGPFWMAATAIGVIKVYSIVLSLINISLLPLAYILLKRGYDPTIVYVAKFFINIVIQVFRYIFVNRYLRFSFKELFIYFMNLVSVFAVLFVVLLLSSIDQVYTIPQILVGTLIIELALITVIYFLGLSREEKAVIKDFVSQKMGCNKIIER